MSTKDTITVISYENQSPTDSQKNMIPGLQGVRAKVSEMRKSVLTESLSSLISDLHEIVQKLPASSEQSELESISVAIQISAQGSAAMIVSASTEVTNAVTLTFKVRKGESNG
jgi:hypothetical protein